MSSDEPVLIKVVDETGSPVQGAFVSVLRSTVAFPEIALVTDSDGIVQLSLPAGRFVIGADAAGGRHAELELESGDTAPGRDVVLTVRRR